MMEQRLEKEALSELDKSLNKEIEIDLIDILRKIITYRRVLYKAAGIGLIVGVVVALSMPSQYTVQVTLSPEIGNSKGSGGLAGLAASFFGKWSYYGRNSRCFKCISFSRYSFFNAFLIRDFKHASYCISKRG